ncbi:MBL fold metallo-hydrolase [Dactylosporangium sp. CA-092794]|uniref:MBL fold metallo-hydrolase n=1 Tax=Dactylosporangium sp. CA-092794 TaxID=3239929 RepID=UPI003D8C7EFC
MHTHSGHAHVAGPLHGHRLLDDPVSVAAVHAIPVGHRTLVGLSDGFLLMSPGFLGTPEAPTAGHDTLRRRYGEVRLPLGCFLLPGDRAALIDTGLGAHDFEQRDTLVGGNLLSQLARQGVRPDDVAVLALSHLHADHSGTIGDPVTGRPVFANAQTFVGRGDWEYFVERELAPVPIAPHTRAALLELERRGQITLTDGEQNIAAGLRSISAPGHTPGHTVYAVHDHGVRVLVLGDAMHCPQQLDHLDWQITFDVDPVLARQTRDRLHADLAAHGGGAVGCHFPELRLGRILTRAA